MQRISRIYLGNCGYSMAWYDGLLLDLTDPETHQPTDTIINLENGGGKTSLLGMFTGQVMRATGNKADPKQVQQILKRQLEA